MPTTHNSQVTSTLPQDYAGKGVQRNKIMRRDVMNIFYDIDKIAIYFISSVKQSDLKISEETNYTDHELSKLNGVICHGICFINGNSWHYVIFKFKIGTQKEIARLSKRNKDIFEFKQVDPDRYRTITKVFNLSTVKETKAETKSNTQTHPKNITETSTDNYIKT